jgi:hypothetical protein
MDITVKENMARMLAGNYVKTICEKNNIETDDDIDNFVELNENAQNELKDILRMYIYEMNSKDETCYHYIS